MHMYGLVTPKNNSDLKVLEVVAKITKEKRVHFAFTPDHKGHIIRSPKGTML